jgi:hypothetical protein
MFQFSHVKKASDPYCETSKVMFINLPRQINHSALPNSIIVFITKSMPSFENFAPLSYKSLVPIPVRRQQLLAGQVVKPYGSFHRFTAGQIKAMWVSTRHMHTKIVTKSLGRSDRAWHIDRITWQIDDISLDRLATPPGQMGMDD